MSMLMRSVSGRTDQRGVARTPGRSAVLTHCRPQDSADRRSEGMDSGSRTSPQRVVWPRHGRTGRVRRRHAEASVTPHQRPRRHSRAHGRSGWDTRSWGARRPDHYPHRGRLRDACARWTDVQRWKRRDGGHARIWMAPASTTGRSTLPSANRTAGADPEKWGFIIIIVVVIIIISNFYCTYYKKKARALQLLQLKKQ